MANEAAWQSGWDSGKQRAADMKAGKKGKVGNKVPDTKPVADSNKVADPKASPNFWGKVGEALKHITPFKKGGPVKRTGLALLHKGEHVVPAKRRSKRAGKRSILKH